MLKLFQTGSCKRLPYLIILICLVAFDFAKGPIQNYVERSTQGIQAQIRAADGTELQSTFKALGRKIDNTVSAEERERRRLEPMTVDFAKLAADAVAMEAKTSAVSSIYISILIGMGFVSYVVLIWMVFARIRDIAWPTWIGFAVLALPLFVRLFGSDVPLTTFYAVQGSFFLGLTGLALVPSNFGDPMPAPGPRPLTAQRTVSPGQFGRRT